MPPRRTFVGFGFGAIQAGLFLYEADRSSRFDRLVVAEVDANLVAAVRTAGEQYHLNIAHADRVETVRIDNVELLNPRDPDDRAALVSAIADADEIGTALPSIDIYNLGGAASVASVLADGLADARRSKPALIYTAENHNHAAEALDAVLPETALPHQCVNTVIGKMSGVIAEPDAIERLSLATIAPTLPRAFLVEAFNRILISRVTLPGFERGIDVFAEKADLLPFEEAKLFGHNAIHALMAYLAEQVGLDVMSQVADAPAILDIARAAFLDESGTALIRKHAALGDPLFTPEGFGEYADDLLERMVCPFLDDRVARVGRDHLRKLGYGDRLFGTMRLVLGQGLTPMHLALGAAAGVESLIRRQEELTADQRQALALPASADDLSRDALAALLRSIWGQATDAYAEPIINLTFDAMNALPVTSAR